MRRALPDILPWALVVMASTALLWVLRNQPNLDAMLQWKSPTGHLEVVTLVSVTCAALAGVVSVVVLRSHNTRLLWLAMAFLSMSGLYAVHGLTPPGIILESEYNAVIGFSGRLAFLACSAFLAGSAITWKGRVAEAVARRRGLILMLTVAALVGYAGLALWWPEVVPRWFAPPSPEASAPVGGSTTVTPVGSGSSYGGDY